MATVKKVNSAKLLRKQIEEQLLQIMTGLHAGPIEDKDHLKRIKKAAKLLSAIAPAKKKADNKKKKKAAPAKRVKKAAPKPKADTAKNQSTAL
jgi:hypothetical protein